MDGSLYVIIGGDKKVKVGRTIYYYLVIGGQGNTRAFAGGGDATLSFLVLCTV